MYQASPVGAIELLKQRLVHRLKELARESGEPSLVMPVGLVFAIDKEHGGDATAEELVNRFGLLDFESRNVIDFYFLGWHRSEEGDPHKIAFDLAAFEGCRRALRKAGVEQFGGNADLLLVDAVFEQNDVSLRFEEAIRIDLSVSREDKVFPTLGSFLQSIIDAAAEVQRNPGPHGPVFSLSDKLGLVMAKRSLLDTFLEKFGALIGAKKLAAVAVRNLGPTVQLRDL